MDRDKSIDIARLIYNQKMNTLEKGYPIEDSLNIIIKSVIMIMSNNPFEIMDLLKILDLVDGAIQIKDGRVEIDEKQMMKMSECAKDVCKVDYFDEKVRSLNLDMEDLN